MESFEVFQGVCDRVRAFLKPAVAPEEGDRDQPMPRGDVENNLGQPMPSGNVPARTTLQARNAEDNHDAMFMASDVANDEATTSDEAYNHGDHQEVKEEDPPNSINRGNATAAVTKLVPATVLVMNLSLNEFVRFTNDNTQCSKQESVYRTFIFLFVVCFGVFYMPFPQIEDCFCRYTWGLFKVLAVCLWLFVTTSKYIVCWICRFEGHDHVAPGTIDYIGFFVGSALFIWGILAMGLSKSADTDENGNPKKTWKMIDALQKVLHQRLK